jgi:putative Mg2+ transporter-C (MgtC) family protein
MNELFPESANDPTRLPAQILTGIGFVGAGTILSNGVTVKGVTTAASLLVATCIGLAVGAGFYEGAIISTLAVFFILCFGTPAQKAISKNFKKTVITVTSKNLTGTLSKAQEVLEENNIEVFSVKQTRNDTDRTIIIKFRINYQNGLSKAELLKQLKSIEGVTEVDFAKRVSD